MVPSSLKIMSIDASLACTGYSIWLMTYENDTVKNIGLLEYGCIPLKEGDTDTRCRLLVDKVSEIVDRNAVRAVYIEETSGGFIGNKATAVSLMKIVAACYAVIGYLHTRNIYCRTIHPKTWQSDLGLRKGTNSKEWSIRIANRMIESSIGNSLPSKKPLVTKSYDSNAADAICIGAFVLQNMNLKKMMIPNV
jgi:Holliday junction resolvasome RuvABC endonuclease subunit